MSPMIGCSEFHFGRLWMARTATPLFGPSARVVEALWASRRRRACVVAKFISGDRWSAPQRPMEDGPRLSSAFLISSAMRSRAWLQVTSLERAALARSAAAGRASRSVGLLSGCLRFV